MILVATGMGIVRKIRLCPPGLYVVSAHVLVRLVAYGEMDGNRAFAWMRRIPPTAIVGQ
jgi:hypothetical protein